MKADKGTPVLIRDIARVELAPDERRPDRTQRRGRGGGGIAMARYGQNALEVIHNLKDKIAEISPRPAGRRDHRRPVYDRSDLIHRRHRNAQAHADRGKPDRRAGLRGLPAACAQRAGGDPDAAGGRADRLHRHAPAGHELQPDEPGGIAIAIGAMVDAAIVMIENAHKHLERLPEAPPAIARKP